MDPVRTLLHAGLGLTRTTLQTALEVVQLVDTLVVSSDDRRERTPGQTWPAEERGDLSAATGALRDAEATAARRSADAAATARVAEARAVRLSASRRATDDDGGAASPTRPASSTATRTGTARQTGTAKKTGTANKTGTAKKTGAATTTATTTGTQGSPTTVDGSS